MNYHLKLIPSQYFVSNAVFASSAFTGPDSITTPYAVVLVFLDSMSYSAPTFDFIFSLLEGSIMPLLSE
jgi:hypothetical protein